MRNTSGTKAWISAVGGAVAIITLLIVSQANAQDAATAEILFREGKRLMDNKQYAQACPKFAESNRIDPGTGTLLALALCHQNEGKLASAWAEYQEVASRAQKEASPERAKVASARAAALEGRLSVLTVRVSAESAEVVGLEVKRDGTVLGQATWGLGVPMDRGEHIVEAAAPGRKPWSTKVTLATEKDKQVVSVPVLEDIETAGPTGTNKATANAAAEEPRPRHKPLAKPAAAAAQWHPNWPAKPIAVAPQPQEAQERPREDGQGSWIPAIAWTGVGLGAAAVVTGAAVAFSAKSSYDDAMRHCGSNIGASSNSLCEPAYTNQRNSAVNQASIAGWLLAGGATVAATGVVLILTAPGRKKDGPRTGLNIVPGGVMLQGEF